MVNCLCPQTTRLSTCLPCSCGSGHGIFMRILFSVFYPSRYQELLYYQHHITDLDQCFHWAVVLSYDAQFWHTCAIQGLLFSTFDQQLYITMLDTMATKVSACRCFWCQHFDHKVVNCPFPWRPCWRRIQHWRKLLKASWVREINRGTCSSIPSPRAPAPSCPLSSTRAGKSALSINQTRVPSPTAEGPMSADTVSKSIQLESVILQAQSPLNLDSF